MRTMRLSSRTPFSLALALLLACCLALVAAPAEAQQHTARRALVIGIDGYLDPDLAIPGLRTGEDALQVAAVLQTVAGYDTVVTVPRNADKKAFAKALTTFSASVQSGDLVLVFYSGHGLEFGGDNYLLMADAEVPLPTSQIETRAALDLTAVSQRGLLENLRSRNPGNIVLIINACRSEVGPRATLGAGDPIDIPAPSARVAADPGTMVIYATSSGKPARVCLDRDCSTDTNPMTVFTRRLVEVLRTPNLPAKDLTDVVGSDVEQDVRTSVGELQLVSVDDQISYAYKKSLYLGPVSDLPALPGGTPPITPEPPAVDPLIAETARQCAQLAAPEWSTHTRPGVPFTAIDSATAIATCTDAHARDPASTDVATWLARALWAGGRFAEAQPLFAAAVAAGNDEAAIILASALQGSNGAPEDLAQSARLLMPVAASGHPVAEASLGLLYQLGRGVPPDYAEALRLYGLASAKGNADANFALGYLYDTGLGVPVDAAAALRYYTLAANDNHALAQYALGALYESGRGVLASKTEARRYYHLAATSGIIQAQGRLAALGE